MMPTGLLNWRRVSHSQAESKILYLSLWILVNTQLYLVVVIQLLSHDQLFATPWTGGSKHARLSCPPLSPWVCSDSCPLSRWCHPAISSSAIPFSSCLQSFPASRSFPMSQLLVSGGQRIGASASALVLSMDIQGWFPVGSTSLISFWHNNSKALILGKGKGRKVYQEGSLERLRTREPWSTDSIEAKTSGEKTVTPQTKIYCTWVY